MNLLMNVDFWLNVLAGLLTAALLVADIEEILSEPSTYRKFEMGARALQKTESLGDFFAWGWD